MIKDFMYGILYTLYPPKCVICTDIIPVGKRKNFLCDNCKKNIPWKENFIQNEICPEENFVFDFGMSPFLYRDLRKSIHFFKFNGNKYFGLGFGKLMWEYFSKNYINMIDEIDMLIPVPIHKKKMKKRGFNQSDIIADEFSRLSNIPCRKDILMRNRNTIPQSLLKSRKERKKNLENAFTVILKDDIENKNIILIDDIYTTGETVNECARELYKFGANRVGFFTLSIVHDYTED